MRRRWLFSALVGTLSVIASVALYLSIVGLLENSRTDRDVKRIANRAARLERPTSHELANRVRLGLRRCEREPGCLGEIGEFIRRFGQP